MTGTTPFRQHRLDQRDRTGAYARRAAAERDQLQRHDQPDDVLGASGAPTPQQCDRIRLRCRVSTSAAAILTLASFPKPVLMP